jgi:YggT family protein
MLTDTMQFVLDTLLQAYAALMLLRFHLHWLRAPLRNPLGEFIMLLTNPLVLRMRRFIPAAWGLDTSTLLLAVGVEMSYLAATLYLHHYPISVLPLFAWTLVKLLKISIYLLMAALFAEALLSWTNPGTPLSAILSSMTRPFLRPFQRFVPPAGGFDFSFLILFYLCYIILALPLGWLEGMVLRAL